MPQGTWSGGSFTLTRTPGLAWIRLSTMSSLLLVRLLFKVFWYCWLRNICLKNADEAHYEKLGYFYDLHNFSGVVPRSLPSSACTQVPKFGLEIIGKSVSMPEQQMQQQQQTMLPQSQSQHPLNQDIKKITTSVSTLRIPNPKPQLDKVSSTLMVHIPFIKISVTVQWRSDLINCCTHLSSFLNYFRNIKC